MKLLYILNLKHMHSSTDVELSSSRSNGKSTVFPRLLATKEIQGQRKHEQISHLSLVHAFNWRDVLRTPLALFVCHMRRWEMRFEVGAWMWCFAGENSGTTSSPSRLARVALRIVTCQQNFFFLGSVKGKLQSVFFTTFNAILALLPTQLY